ncbi:hypothetical protein BOZ38_RS26205, partial [Escherichia coli]
AKKPPKRSKVELPDALRSSGLQNLLQHVESSCVCRPDKAFTPHPALGAQCLMRYAYQAYKIYCNMLNLHAFVGG